MPCCSIMWLTQKSPYALVFFVAFLLLRCRETDKMVYRQYSSAREYTVSNPPVFIVDCTCSVHVVHGMCICLVYVNESLYIYYQRFVCRTHPQTVMVCVGEFHFLVPEFFVDRTSVSRGVIGMMLVPIDFEVRLVNFGGVLV